MNELSKEMNKILNDAALKDSLAAPALKSFLGKIEDLEDKLDKEEVKNQNLRNDKDRLSKSNDNYNEELTVANHKVKNLTERLGDIVARESECLRVEIRNEMRQEMIEFLKNENNMILRNAEIKQTLNKIVPLVVPIGEYNAQGMLSGGAIVQNETTTETTTTTKE